MVFLSGLGEDVASTWTASGVPDIIAAGGGPGAATNATRVCVYDRPGLGASDLAPTPRTVSNEVAELNTVVERGAIPAPVVLVAQGYGCFVAREFGKDHLRSVAGLVLVDPPLDIVEPTPLSTGTPGQLAEYGGVADLNANLGAYGAGALPPPPAPAIVLGYGDGTPLPPNAPPGAPTTSSGPPGAPRDTWPGAPAPTTPEHRRDLQAQLARKGPFGSFTFVEGTGSYIEYWKPDAVVEAIRRVLADDRGLR